MGGGEKVLQINEKYYNMIQVGNPWMNSNVLILRLHESNTSDKISLPNFKMTTPFVWAVYNDPSRRVLGVGIGAHLYIHLRPKGSPLMTISITQLSTESL